MMMRTTLARWLDSDRVPLVAGAISLALGLFFTFVWAPHPWGWQGIDSYHELARALARGESFPTTDVPWGYTFYATLFYATVGERLWAPLLGQVIANAFVPALLYRLVRPLSDQRTAALAALIVGVFSFNTIYASTESSDSICTVLFLSALVLLSAGWRHGSVMRFAASGVLFGIVPQFRPNLVLLPAAIAGVYLLWTRFSKRAIVHAAVFTAMVVALQMPWIVRNYRLTGMVLPTSTHGGVQLWYGTLQVGPFLESRAHNPRTHFESPPFPYTSLSKRPVMIGASRNRCVDAPSPETRLVYWTDRDAQRHTVTPRPVDAASNALGYELPPQPNDTALYYYFEQTAPGTTGHFTAPVDGAANPYVFFISDNHLGDLDRHHDLLDIFDLVRVLRHVAWGEAVPNPTQLDLTHDGQVDAADVEQMVLALIPDMAARLAARPLTRIDTGDAAVTLRFADGSWLSVPRDFSGKETDLNLSLDGEMAPAVISRWRTFTSLAHTDRPRGAGECLPADTVTVNRPFNWSEPHMMQRYMALALDNIRRDPWAFASASLYRVVRLFVVRGTNDLSTAQQFRWSRVVYGVATALSIAYLAVFLAGVAIAFRRRSALLLFLVPIVYVPVTICFVLTNMRYTVTVQPLMFVFVAVAVLAGMRLLPDERRLSAGAS